MEQSGAVTAIQIIHYIGYSITTGFVIGIIVGYIGGMFHFKKINKEG